MLSGRKATGRITGNLQLFREKLSNLQQAEKILKDVSAYVPQDTMFFPCQTRKFIASREAEYYQCVTCT